MPLPSDLRSVRIFRVTQEQEVRGRVCIFVLPNPRIQFSPEQGQSPFLEVSSLILCTDEKSCKSKSAGSPSRTEDRSTARQEEDSILKPRFLLPPPPSDHSRILLPVSSLKQRENLFPRASQVLPSSRFEKEKQGVASQTMYRRKGKGNKDSRCPPCHALSPLVTLYAVSMFVKTSLELFKACLWERTELLLA